MKPTASSQFLKHLRDTAASQRASKACQQLSKLTPIRNDESEAVFIAAARHSALQAMHQIASNYSRRANMDTPPENPDSTVRWLLHQVERGPRTYEMIHLQRAGMTAIDLLKTKYLIPASKDSSYADFILHSSACMFGFLAESGRCDFERQIKTACFPRRLIAAWRAEAVNAGWMHHAIPMLTPFYSAT